MKIFSYGNSAKFAAGTSVETAIKRLKSRIYKMDLVTALASSVQESKLAGKVGENSVVLNRVRPFFWNLFKPHFYGRFVKSGDRVALEGLFTVSIFAKVICFVLLTVLVISEIVFLFGAPTATQAQFEFPAILFPPAMALALLSFIYISKWIFGSDVRWLSDEIEKALNSVEK